MNAPQQNKQLFLIAICFVAVFSFVLSYALRYYPHSVSNDIRNRTVGVRLAAEGKNPYFHKYNPAVDSTNVLDPFERFPNIVNGNTVTPAVMLALHPISHMPQSKLNAWWFWLSFAAFFTCIFLFYRHYIRHTSKQSFMMVILAIAMLGVVGFRMHLLSGQMYIFYTVIVLLSLQLWKMNKSILAGIVAGVMVAFRFPFALLYLPIFITNKKFAISFAASILTILLATFAFYQENLWQEFLYAMHWHSLENEGTIPTVSHPPVVQIPTVLEGVPTSASAELRQYVAFLNADLFSVQKLLVQKVLPSNTLILVGLLGLFAAVAILFVGFKKVAQLNDLRLPILFCAFLVFVSDYFLPAPRFNYNFVQWLIPLFLVHTFNFKVPKIALLLFTLGICFNIYKLYWIPDCYSVGELLGLLALLLVMKENKHVSHEI